MNVVFGASGFAKEVEWLFYDIFSNTIDYYIDIDEKKDIQGIKVISEFNFFNILNRDSKELNAFIGIGSPKLRNKIVNGLADLDINFPVLIHPSVILDKRNLYNQIGKGSIICANSVLTTNIKIGEFVQINLDCTIGHDSIIHDFCTISPSVNISGNVQIGKNVFIGTGAIILENCNICSEVIIGASTLVNKSINEPGTYVGIPAKKIK